MKFAFGLHVEQRGSEFVYTSLTVIKQVRVYKQRISDSLEDSEKEKKSAF